MDQEQTKGRVAHADVIPVRAERQKMRVAYELAKKQNQDDPCRTSHGDAAETLFRNFLGRFLPKRFGVAKGYIVSPRIGGAPPNEEWDIIIYDALESPVLFYRAENGEEKQGLPVENVLAVLEVKATLSVDNTKVAAAKLRKLRPFLSGPDRSPEGHYLRKSFFCQTIFFETLVNTLGEYRKSLQHLVDLCGEENLRYLGGTVLYSGRLPVELDEYSGLLSLGSDPYGELNNDQILDMSEAAQYVVSPNETASLNVFWDPNGFYHYLWELIMLLKGEEPRPWYRVYGADWTKKPGARLFHPGPWVRFGGFDDGRVSHDE